MIVELRDESDTRAVGAYLWRCIDRGAVVFLSGDLGAGKTTLVRGFLRAAGHQDAVKSPTFTLVETYRCGGRTIYHFDLYRLADPEELEWIGIRDYLDPEAICFFEWPQCGAGVLPEPDVDLQLVVFNATRRLTIAGRSVLGRMVEEKIAKLIV